MKLKKEQKINTLFPQSIIKKWDGRGLRFISDLLKPSTGSLYSKEDIKRVYGIEMAFLCYERLTRRFSQSLMNSVERKVESPNIPFKIQAVASKEKITKYASDIFIEALAQENLESDERKKHKWESQIGEYIIGTSTHSSMPQSHVICFICIIK